MPLLTGRTKEKAIEMLDLQSLELEYDVSETEYSESVPLGHVVRTEPENGQPLVTGQRVKLIISLGNEPKVPEVEGKSVEDVKSSIQTIVPDAVIEYLIEEINHPTVEVGKVVKTSLETGASLVDVESITLYISTGPVKKVLPNVVGKAFEDAKNALIAAGFENIVPNYVDDSSAAGTVIKQSPKDSSAEIPVNTAITLDVSNGPKMATKTISLDTLPQNMTDLYTIKVFVLQDGQYVLDSKVTVNPQDTSIEIEVTGMGVQTYRIVFPDNTAIIKEVDFSK